MTDTSRAALDGLLARLRADGRVAEGVDREALRRGAVVRAGDLGVALGAYLEGLGGDPDEEDRLVAVVGDGGGPALDEVVGHLEAATDELEAANADRRALAEELAAVGEQLDQAARELDSVTAQLDERSRDLERLGAIIDGLVEVHPHPAAVVDAGLVVRAWSTALAQLTDVPVQEAVGRRITKVSHLFPQATVGTALRSLLSDAPTRSSAATEVDWQDASIVVTGTAVVWADEVVAVVVTAASG